MKKAIFNFSPELHVFLEPSRRQNPFEYEFTGPQSVKHLIEAAGVPHTEVSRIQVNGAPAGFDIQVQDGDQVEVFSFLALDNLPYKRAILASEAIPALSWITTSASSPAT